MVHHKSKPSESREVESSKMDDIIEGIKQSPWNHPIIVASVAVLVVVLAIGGIYMIVNDVKIALDQLTQDWRSQSSMWNFFHDKY